jgi:membrane associated rhomboid family serine protease
MGIQDRDYYREGPSFLDRVSAQGATVWLIAITCGIFFGQYMPGGQELERLGVYDPNRILEGELWRLLTPVFLHAGIWHLFFNMLVLFWAGQRLEEVYGSREFVLFYLLSGIGANVIYLAAQLAGLSPMSQALGASGAVTATMIVFACHFPHTQVRVWFILPMPIWLLTVLYVGFTTLAGFGEVQNGGGARVAHFAHLGGAVVGFLYFKTGIRFSAFLKRGEQTHVRPKLRVHSPPLEEEGDVPEPVGASVEAPRPAGAADEQLEAKLDAVLEKVSKYGQESLTPEEREILFRASELYKKRRK